ncbi:3'-5' exonuclease [Salinimicrobium sediminilitoris]|uniref:3'-5' exonuclease n=1 Tax=Salinimicrobium sediminilitoris TaxID=2876715 RepID=UPI001E6369F3|nr:3'-5' exonuclease [Salinimicrobium sediminilitoris]MCC8359602.1 3'-5' exonuclease [Salinimicrobium sediminilitoris]
MIKKISLRNLLFLDIETVPENATFAELSEEKQKLWESKSKYQRKEEFTPEEFYDRAGIWAEFGKIVCISVGYFALQGEKRTFRTTTFCGEEKELLKSFKDLLESHFGKPQHLLCAHNGKEFDFPYIARRMLIHNIELPNKLNLFGKRPWEVPHLDTLELWKFGDYKHFTSLKLLCNVLGIPSPKEDIDGSQVCKVFYEEDDMDRIVSYCERDVVAIAQVILRLRQEPLLEESEIMHVEIP